jgi:hypothetical protein
MPELEWSINVDGEQIPCARLGIVAYAKAFADDPGVKHVSVWHGETLLLTVLGD